MRDARRKCAILFVDVRGRSFRDSRMSRLRRLMIARVRDGRDSCPRLGRESLAIHDCDSQRQRLLLSLMISLGIMSASELIVRATYAAIVRGYPCRLISFNENEEGSVDIVCRMDIRRKRSRSFVK